MSVYLIFSRRGSSQAAWTSACGAAAVVNFSWLKVSFRKRCSLRVFFRSSSFLRVSLKSSCCLRVFLRSSCYLRVSLRSNWWWSKSKRKIFLNIFQRFLKYLYFLSCFSFPILSNINKVKHWFFTLHCRKYL